MAAWLQKRLKDAEALLEQADRTAQRVVVKDKDNPKIPSTGVSAGPGAGVCSSQSRQLTTCICAALTPESCRRLLSNWSHTQLKRAW